MGQAGESMEQAGPNQFAETSQAKK